MATRTINQSVNKCERCGHEWTQRIHKKPNQCPKCKNRSWDEKRARKSSQRRETAAGTVITRKA